MQNPAHCFVVHPADNVATLLNDAPAGPVGVLGRENLAELLLAEPIALGHKAALAPISAGEAIVKFGVSIGSASSDIRAGQWVHLHNCRSNFDARSQTLDLHTGAATDTRYT